MKPKLRPIKHAEVDLEACLRKVRKSATPHVTKTVLGKLLKAAAATQVSGESLRTILNELLEPDTEIVSC